ncbi:MAG: hypothetical protein ACJ77F_03480 [Chloroflexota bacterium]
MRKRHAASRLVLLATIAALAASVVGTTAVQARAPGSGQRSLKAHQEPTRATAGVRSFRQVDVGSLPAGKGPSSPYVSRLNRPAQGFRTAAPSSVSVAPLPTFATTNTDPEITQATAYDGPSRNSRSETMGEPPDPWIAAGPDHVVQALNTVISIADRSGNVVNDPSMFFFFGLDAFYDPGDVAFFDPRVIYDSLHQRWIAIEASFDCFTDDVTVFGTGYLDIAISDSADPNGTWQLLSLGFTDALPDYPGIGTSTDKVVVSGNVFALGPSAGPMACEPSDPFLGTEMDVFAWSELLGNGEINVATFNNVVPSFPNNYFAWRPSLQTPAAVPTVFAVAEQADGDMAYARITGSPAGGGVTSLSILDLDAVVSNILGPPDPKQPGAPATIINAVDERPTDAIWKDNRLATVSTYPCDPAGGVAEARDCVRVTELNTTTASAPTLIQDVLVGEEGADLYMGGIGYALNDDLHVVWTRSSATAGNYPSSYGAYQSAAAAAGSLSARSVLSAGTGTYPGTRWGDYVGVAQDPQVPNAVWQANEYSAGPTNWWATEITQLQTGGSSYVPIPPVRVLDTRTATGLSGVFSANVPRSFQVANTPGIPANAVAVTGNVTVVNQTAAGYVSITPNPVVSPQSSTINFPLGDVRANNVTTPLNGTGKLAAVYKASAGKSTHIVVDITGYFLAGDQEGTYSTITPVRVLDTRTSTGLIGPFLANQPRTLSIADDHGIPADATAITGNLTVVGQTRAGYLAITPDPDADPDTSTLNFPTGDVRANGVSVPLNGAGDLSIVFKANGGSANVLLDVTGYYRDDPSGLQFFPLTPGRIMDTRPNIVLSGVNGAFASSVPKELQVSGHWGVPSTAGAVTGNLTVVGQTKEGYVAATLAEDPVPTTSVLNFPLGDVRANGVTVPVNGGGSEWFVYKASAGKTTQLILDVSGYFN